MSEVIKIKAEEITILPAEIKERVEKEISLALVEANATEELIGQMEQELLPLTIKDNNDKEGYLIVSEARKNVKRARVFVQKVFKKGREIANLEVKEWLAKEKEVIPRIQKIETTLELQEEAYEKAENDRKAAEKARKEQQGAERMRDMISFGAKMEGLYWVLNGVSYEVALVKEVDPEVYGDIRAEFQAEFNKAEEVRIKGEEKVRQDRERLEQEQREINEQRAQLKGQRRAYRVDVLRALGMKVEPLALTLEGFGMQFTDTRMEMLLDSSTEDWDRDLDKIKSKIAVFEEQEAAVKAGKKKTTARCKQLSDMGLVFDFNDNHYKNFDCFVPTLDITAYDDEKWANMIEKMGPHIEEWKKRKEQEDLRRQQEKIEIARLEGIGKSRREMLKAINGDAGISDLELGQIDEAQWKQDYQTAKSLYDKKQKDAADQKEKERQELLGEKQKYEELVASIKAIHVPVFKSGQYRGKANIIRDFIDGLK